MYQHEVTKYKSSQNQAPRKYRHLCYQVLHALHYGIYGYFSHVCHKHTTNMKIVHVPFKNGVTNL